MPIYAYRCESCGHAQDVLRKISDPVLTACPVCGKETYKKQLTAAGFQLKGSGWYVTDFKGDKPVTRPAEGVPAAEGKGAPEASGAASADAPKADAAPANGASAKSDTAAAPSPSTPSTPSTPTIPSATGQTGSTGSTGGRET